MQNPMTLFRPSRVLLSGLTLLAVTLAWPSSAAPPPGSGGPLQSHHQELILTIQPGSQATFELPELQGPVRLDISLTTPDSPSAPRLVSVVIAQDILSGEMSWTGIDNQGTVVAGGTAQTGTAIMSFCSGPDCVATVARLEVDSLAASTLAIRHDPESFGLPAGLYIVNLWY